MTEQTTTSTAQTGAAHSVAGKYLTFALDKEEYGLEILNVREIVGMMEITAVPQTPKFVKGVVNLRGKVIPVIDLRLKFAMAEVEHNDETCVIVVSVGQVEMGVIVDRVLEVLDIPAESIENAPQFGVDVNTDFILGMGKVGDAVKVLLDIDKVLTAEELTDAVSAVDGHVSEREADAGHAGEAALMLEGAAPAEIQILLPRFKLEYEKVLNDVLKALGMLNRSRFADRLEDFDRFFDDLDFLFFSITCHLQ